MLDRFTTYSRFNEETQENDQMALTPQIKSQFISLLIAQSPQNLFRDEKTTDQQRRQMIKNIDANWRKLERRAGRRVSEKDAELFLQELRTTDTSTSSLDGEMFTISDRVFSAIDKSHGTITRIANLGVVTVLYDDGISCDTTVNYLSVVD
jgi:hypothetical protein